MLNLIKKMPSGDKIKRKLNSMGRNKCYLMCDEGRAVAQAVSRWFLIAAARVRVRAAYGVCGGQSSTRAGFLRVFRFPLPIIPSS
jgi:hypothetical protein